MITLYTREDCGVCNQAAEFLKKSNVWYNKKIIGADVARDDVINLLRAARANTVGVQLPIVFVDDKYIGGYNELVQWITRKTTVRTDNER